MKNLTVKKLNIRNAGENIEKTEIALEENTEKVAINTINWAEYPYLPDVNFRIAHTENEIILKYYVTEKNPKAVETKTNGDVYKDSCVEFFLSPNANGFYYNFEFNCIGTVHLAYGNGRHNRQFIDQKLVKNIITKSSLGNKPLDLKNYNSEWTILIIIPKSVMANDELVDYSGVNAKSNLYKCGDETDEMHFVSWNAIGTETPDYHQYQYFGNLSFE